MWKFILSKVVGASHLKLNLPCQDSVACEVLFDNSLIAAVADGAGSAVLAERGAEIAVKTVIESLKLSLTENRTDFQNFLREAAASARKEIETEVNQKGLSLRDYASTLIAVVLTPVGGGAMQIGDGVILASDGFDEWSWVFWPQHGEFINTTFFLTDDDAMSRLEIEEFSGAITDIALMSDGLESLALHYESKTVYNPFISGMFRPLFDIVESSQVFELSLSLDKFLSSDKIRSRTDDDVSIILASRRKIQSNR